MNFFLKIIKKIVFKLYRIKSTIIKPKSFKGVKILLYHDTNKLNFETHLSYLSCNYKVISLGEFVEHTESGKKLNNTFVITFDDGVKENFELLDTFKKYKIRPTIFITGYVDTKKAFWFNKFEQAKLISLLKINNSDRLKKLSETEEDLIRESLNTAEINQMKNFVDFQPHTFSHPSLVMCTDDEIENEIIQSCNIVRKLTGQIVFAFAPPFGIYDQRVIQAIKNNNIKCCLTIKPGTNSDINDLFALKRIGIPKHCDIDEFIIRIDGVWDKIRSLPIFKSYSSFYKQFYE